MSITLILGILAALMALVCLGSIFHFLFSGRQSEELRSLMQASRSGLGAPSEERKLMEQDPTGQAYEEFKKRQRKQLAKKKEKLTTEELLYHAGIYSEKERQEFELTTKLMPLVFFVLALFGFWFFLGDLTLTILGVIIATVFGMRFPFMLLERKIKRRAEDIMFYLPLVIEQVAIGVSSSLDIGPCLQRVVQMADERDSHNVVTEIFRNVEYLVRSGISLEEALIEIGTRSGHNELKHSMIALAQVAKHGGEITKQLHELADAVSQQRETKIEAKIKTLELQATGPVAMVFMGFILILLIGFGIQIKAAFN